jgi:hypothetical protein
MLSLKIDRLTDSRHHLPVVSARKEYWSTSDDSQRKVAHKSLPMKFTTGLSCIALAVAASSTVDAHTLKGATSLAALSTAPKALRIDHQEQVDLAALIDEQLVLRGGAGVDASALVQRLKIGFYFSLWYALNVVYNSMYP